MVKVFSGLLRFFDFKLVVCSVPVVLFQLPVLATQSVVLAWTPSSDPDVVANRIYYGTASQNYVSQVTVGNTNQATISGLADEVTYYFAATSIDSAGDESPFSNEAVYTVPSAAATLTALQGSDGWFSFSVSGISGYQYVVQSSTYLINWVSVQTNTAPFTFTDTNAASLPQCFYRTLYLTQGVTGLAGSGTINGSVTTANGTTLSPGTNGVIGTLTINNDLTLGGGNLVFDVGNGSGNHDLVNVGGTVAMNSGTVIINVVGGSLNPGVYPLFHYTGGITGASANLGLVIPVGINATLIVDTPNNNLVLLVSMF